MLRTEFQTLLEKNPGTILLKFGADWCQPCKDLEKLLCQLPALLPPTVVYYQMDISSDLGCFLKAKRQITGIPVFLVYKKGNLTPYADKCLTGPTHGEVLSLFSSF